MKRATLWRDGTGRYVVYFNPRPREEGDLLRERFYKPRRYFNPRPREEGDKLHTQS